MIQPDRAAGIGSEATRSSRHAFLSALERSRLGHAADRLGAAAPHCSKPPHGEMLGAAPCYLKSHSRGEYVFDQGWADAYERAGGNYYPKLQVSVPFTPATGPRLLVRGRPRTQTPRERCAGALDSGAVRTPAGVIGACHVPARRRTGTARRQGLPQAHRPAIPLAQCRLRELRRFPGARSRRASARPSSANGATRWTAGITIQCS